MTLTKRETGADLVRALAIVLVILRHAAPGIFGGAGIVGVVAFFTLSGYLITGVLMRDLMSQGKIDYRKFYAHRFLRLVPALLFFVATLALVTIAWNPLDDKGDLARTLLVALSYTADLPFFHGSLAIGHLWTLAVEEQFYILWPIVLIIGNRTRRVGLSVAISTITLYSACIVSSLTLRPVESLYTLPSSWAVAMTIGALLRVRSLSTTSPTPRFTHPVSWIVMSLLILGGVALSPEAKNSMASYLILGPAVAIATCVLLVSLSQIRVSTRSVLVRVTLFVAKISYAAYLWNFPIHLWSVQLIPNKFISVVCTILATLGMASISYYVIEKPVADFRSRRSAKGAFSTLERGMAAKS